MTIPTPGLKVASHYSYDLDPPVRFTVESPNMFCGDVHRVGVIVHEWNGERRPAVIVATTTTTRAASAQVPLDGFQLRRGPNEDIRLLDVFADLIADAEQRHAQAADRAAHPANQPPPSRVPGTGHPAYLSAAMGDLIADIDLSPIVVHPEPDHLCQHGNLTHPCACAMTEHHGRRLCQGVNTDA